MVLIIILVVLIALLGFAYWLFADDLFDFDEVYDRADDFQSSIDSIAGYHENDDMSAMFDDDSDDDFDDEDELEDD